MYIYSSFDGGNISLKEISRPNEVSLHIQKDSNSHFFQWFNFRINAQKGESYTIRLGNAGESSYPKGWENYRARYSYDGENWLQADTAYDGKELIIQHQLLHNTVQFAYFAPYSLTRHDALIRWAQQRGAQHNCLGYTVQGRSMDLLSIGRGSKKLWCIARQHPGETMAEWWMEGFIHKLLDPSDPISHRIRERATIYLVPNMNPDGSFLGNLRTNAAGKNLNRVWADPKEETEPEVYWVRRKMHETGLHFCLDIHGDEGLPYNFLAPPFGIPSLTSEQEDIFYLYERFLLRHSPDFQNQYGYPRTPKGKANMGVCSNYISDAFGAMAITLEQPFKDNAILPMPDRGWSPNRAMQFGKANLQACFDLIQYL